MNYLLDVIRWMAGDDTGASSKAIACHMTGGTCDGSYPLDPADLGRCLRLLRLFPDWEPRMPEMAKYSLPWKRLAEDWAFLANSMQEEVGIDCDKGRSAPITYARMKAVIGGPYERPALSTLPELDAEMGEG